MGDPMTLARISSLFLGLFLSLNLLAANPHARLNTARWNALNSTQIGRYYTTQYEGVYLLFDSSLKSETELKMIEGKKTIVLNFALASSDFDYLSWVLFQGFVRYALEKEGADLSTDESELTVWNESMIYLKQREDNDGAVVAPEMDYAYHPQFNYARKRQLSISRFYRLWQEDYALFEAEVLRRKHSLNPNIRPKI